jgi:hypothetical protein|tara:strand:- start:361 stop:558 length:198 start_codon:yes stop_codon:yes gene_type:complete
MLKRANHVGGNQQKVAVEDIQLADPRRELVLKLQRLNQRCLHQRKQNLKEQKQVVKKYHINIGEK